MDRGKIKDLIEEIERNYPVNSWIHNGYNVWPILRIKLYIHLASQEVTNSDYNNTRGFGSIFKLFLSGIEYVKYYFLKRSGCVVYVGDPSRCSNINNVSYNKYFDKMMDCDDNAIYFSKSDSKIGVYRPDRHFLFSNLLFGYKVLKYMFNKKQIQPYYIQEICDYLICNGIELEGFEKKAISFVKNVDLSESLSTKIFNKLKPEKILVSCYYSSDVLGLLIAAHKQSISTIDMQHGGQGKNHLAYCSWSKVPKEGYEALPNIFYTWDGQSAQEINDWAKDTKKHDAIHFGNPWVESWKHGKFKNVEFNWPNNLVLYTMQPIKEPLEEYFIETIQQTKNNYNWWIRLHPRQNREKKLIINQLIYHNLYSYVNIEDATNLPLPEILSHTSAHITKFSGSTLEAIQFGIPTILIDKRGKDPFEIYLKTSDLVEGFFDKDSNELVKGIQRIMSNN
ncbi:MAG: hypothetical protein WEA36_00995 [Balneolaceae bacterium]